ncbi:MAG: peptidoglycan-binding domain-containing protein [Acidobacteriota bacterium]|nr:peptidoglycan-binding protein [Blastocatellia bacterium]MDW8238579.1 peptidoglycan-binding domain-containing protein [Acidobacteriota bacterium]
MKKRQQIIGACLVVVGVVAVDVLTSVGGWLSSVSDQSSPHEVFAQRRGNKKRQAVARRGRSGKRQSVRRGRSQRSVTAQSRRSRRSAAVSRKRMNRYQARRGRVRRSLARYQPLRPGSQMPTDRVLEIQRALIERGFLAEATGVYDQATIEAMKAFQQAENLPVTGRPTAHVLSRLGLSPRPAHEPQPQPPAETPDEPPPAELLDEPPSVTSGSTQRPQE